MIGQEVNSLAQKLLRSARRKRGALQGVNVLNCSHVVPASSATPHLLFLAAVEYGAAGGAEITSTVPQRFKVCPPARIEPLMSMRARSKRTDSCLKKIISYMWSMGANYLRRGNVTN